MDKKEMLYKSYGIEVKDIKKAMISGVRTIEEIEERFGKTIEDKGCRSLVERVLTTACKCLEISMEEVQNLVANGASTVDEIAAVTGAGIVENCGKCKAILQSVIDLKR